MCKVLVKNDKSNAGFFLSNYIYSMESDDFTIEDIETIFKRNSFELEESYVKHMIDELVVQGVVSDRISHYTRILQRF